MSYQPFQTKRNAVPLLTRLLFVMAAVLTSAVSAAVSAAEEPSEAARLKAEIDAVLAEPFAGEASAANETPEFISFTAAKGERIAPLADAMLALPDLSPDDATLALKRGLLAISLTAGEESKIQREREKAFLDAHQDRPETAPFYMDWIGMPMWTIISESINDPDFPAEKKTPLFRETVEPLLPLINRWFGADRGGNRQLPSVLVIAADVIDPDASAGLVVWLTEQLRPVFDRDAQGKDFLMAHCAKLSLGAAHRIQMAGKPMEYDWFDLDGNPISVADHRGKIVLVLFTGFASEFDAKLPALKKIFESLHSDGFEILMQSSVSSADALRDTYGKDPFPWTVSVRFPPNMGRESPNYLEIYGVMNGGIFLVDREGNVILTRSDTVTPELCDRLKTLFPAKADALEACAEELRAVAAERQEEIKKGNNWSIQGEDADSDFGRLARFKKRLLYPTDEMELEITDRLLAFPESAASRYYLSFMKLRTMETIAEEKAAANPTTPPETFYADIFRLIDTICADESWPADQKMSFVSNRKTVLWSMKPYLKNLKGGREEYAQKILDFFAETYRMGRSFQTEDQKGRSSWNQDVYFLGQTFQEVDETDGTRLEERLYETVIPLFIDSPEFEERAMAENLQGALRRLKLVGSELEFETVLLDGTVFNVKDHRGKVVLVNFWGTTCGPCLREFPAMKTLYEKYHDRGYEMVAASYDSESDLDAFLAKNSFPWSFSRIEESKKKGLRDYQAYYGISGIPTTFLVDRDGIVRYTQVGSDDEALEREVEKLFAE